MELPVTRYAIIVMPGNRRVLMMVNRAEYHRHAQVKQADQTAEYARSRAGGESR